MLFNMLKAVVKKVWKEVVRVLESPRVYFFQNSGHPDFYTEHR